MKTSWLTPTPSSNSTDIFSYFGDPFGYPRAAGFDLIASNILIEEDEEEGLTTSLPQKNGVNSTKYYDGYTTEDKHVSKENIIIALVLLYLCFFLIFCVVCLTVLIARL